MNPDPPAHLLADILAEVEAHAHTIHMFVGGVLDSSKGLKKLANVFFVNTNSSVLYAHDKFAELTHAAAGLGITLVEIPFYGKVELVGGVGLLQNVVVA